jgi:hypothetical protein
VLEFEPPLKLDEDYTVVSAEPEQLSLKLIEGKKWRATGGLLTLKTITIDADVIKLGGDAGIQVQCSFNQFSVLVAFDLFNDSDLTDRKRRSAYNIS